ncbi:calcium/sodium antiporter [uncultured Clostridium sp.]|uniref:calcium/sodium antiporter n=1 Tax=uncultured Clostridium sp. TaxID=59620 RepID=UPI002602627A|nr:calcium/sodium antiporter [uncultured Clostridium sp.]
MVNYIFLVVGFILLIKGADFFVDGASSIAKKVGIPSVIVGLTIVSIGTSAPELSVSLTSAMNGSNGLAVGNVLGSNIFNTLIVLGATALVSPLIIKKNLVKFDLLLSLAVTVLLYILIFIFGGTGSLSRVEGVILLAIAVIYIGFLIYSSKKSTANEDENDDRENYKDVKVVPKVLFSILGVILIVFGGDLVVKNASAIAISLGMSEKLIGLTIVAIGTSLPELVTSVVAARKGENGIALGNVLGSNIFNIVLILGLSSVISPIAVGGALAFDLILLIVITLILVLSIILNKKESKHISKKEGFVLIFVYIVYTIYIIMRN